MPPRTSFTGTQAGMEPAYDNSPASIRKHAAYKLLDRAGDVIPDNLVGIRHTAFRTALYLAVFNSTGVEGQLDLEEILGDAAAIENYMERPEVKNND